MYCFSSLEAEHVTLHVATLHQYPFGHRSNLLMAKTKLNPLWVSQHFPILEYLVQKSDLTKLSCWSSYLCIHWRPREIPHQSFKKSFKRETFNFGLEIAHIYQINDQCENVLFTCLQANQNFEVFHKYQITSSVPSATSFQPVTSYFPFLRPKMWVEAKCKDYLVPEPPIRCRIFSSPTNRRPGKWFRSPNVGPGLARSCGASIIKLGHQPTQAVSQYKYHELHTFNCRLGVRVRAVKCWLEWAAESQQHQ